MDDKQYDRSTKRQSRQHCQLGDVKRLHHRQESGAHYYVTGRDIGHEEKGDVKLPTPGDADGGEM